MRGRLKTKVGTFVYVIEAIHGNERFYKIGHTNSCPDQRTRAIQLKCPIPVKLVGLIEGGDKDLEQRLHWDFEDNNIHGEWFNDCQGIRDLVKKHPTELFREKIEREISELIL